MTKKKSENNIRILPKKDTFLTVRGTQFPLMLGWACTVHKAQGLTLQKVEVYSSKKKINYGQVYVALGSVTSLNGIYFVDKFKNSAIRAHSRAAQEYHRQQTLKQLTSIDIACFSSRSFTFTLLNVLCLNKHTIKIKPSANISIHEEYYGRSPIVISKATRSPLLKVLLFYRKNNESLSLFNQNLPQINSGNFSEIIMSDFNINDLHQDCQI